MVSNELTNLLAAACLKGTGGESILDKPLRELLLRAAAPYSSQGSLAIHTMIDDPTHHWMTAVREPAKEAVEFDLFWTLERERSDVASVARFGHRVECASYYLYVAFDKAQVEDFAPSVERKAARPQRGVNLWYFNLVNATFDRYHDLRRALLHDWTPPSEVENLTSCAFAMLSEITPAQSQLRNLFVHDRPRACHELAHHLDLYVDQLKAAIHLASDLEATALDERTKDEEVCLDELQSELLNLAGKPLSLTEAADRLGVTRQALHKRIKLGSALGVMRGSELVVPDSQFVTQNGKPKIVEGLADVVRLFDSSGAGRWSALQFLTGIDPNLGTAPLEVLRAGKKESAVNAARAFLGLDEA